MQLQRNSNIKTLTELHHIYWSATSFILNYNVTDKDRASTSFTQHRMRIFKYKLFSDKLPTLTHLKQRQPNLYTVDECLFCRRHSETQAYLWNYSSQQNQWWSILNRIADKFMQLIQNEVSRNLPTIVAVQHLIHESRTFISKGIISSNFYNFVYSITWLTSITNTIIAEVYNFTYAQIFTHLWKPRCAKVVAYEQILGITNWNKQSKYRSRSFNYSSHLPSIQENDASSVNQSLPWVA